MSVVVYRDGIMAADREVSTAYDLRIGRMTKIAKHRTSLIGAVGRAQDVIAFINWALVTNLDVKELPEFGKKFSGIVADATLVLYFDDRGHDLAVEAPYHAIGGGEAVALGAMYMGASAESACKAACEHTLGCGGGVDVLSL